MLFEMNSRILLHHYDIRLSNGILIHYKASGTGRIPIIFIHGYGMSSAVWDKVLTLFSSKYTCYAPDLPGFGNSDKPENGYSCSELAEDIAQFLDALRISQAILIGHSLGGLTVQHFAVRYPDRVMALVLSNTIASTLPPKGISPAVEERIKGYGTPEENRKVFSATIPHYFDAENISAEDIEYFISVGLQASNSALRETLITNYTTPEIPPEKFADFKALVLIIIAEYDPFGTRDQAIAMRDIFPKSEIREISESGHSPMWEKPIEYTEIVIEFLDSIF